MFLKSVRFKIILWYMFILAITLSLFSALLYHSFSLRLHADIDDLLESRAEGISDSIDTYWESEKLDGRPNNISSDASNSAENENFIKIAQKWVEERSNDPKFPNIVVQIFDNKGVHIASSKNMAHITKLPEKICKTIAADTVYFENTSIEFGTGKPIALRICTIPVVENGKIAYIIQVASSLGSAQSALKILRIVLFLLLPLIVFLTGVIGIFLANIALNPVDRIIDDIHNITAKNLKLRVELPDTNDEIYRLVSTFNDMLARLDRVFSSQRQFIEDLAHELKTPLAILKGEIEVTLKKIRSTQEYSAVLKSSLEEVDRMSNIIDNLLMLARFENNAMELDMEKLDIGLLAEKSVEDITILARAKDITVSFSAAKSIFIKGDERALKRLFLNLLDNAVKYTNKNGAIDVTITEEHDYAKIIIRDTGIGISEDNLSFIFDRFYRVNAFCNQPGFGLGLSIAKSISEAHHGRIEVKSKVNSGTSFSVYLPLA